MAEGGVVDVAASGGLSGATLEKAVRELNEPETSEKRLAAIRELRERLEEWQRGEGSEAEYSLTRLDDDAFLLRFLRTKKFEIDRASQLYINYHKYRHKHSHLLGELTPQAAQGSLSSGMLCVLPERTRDGCKVVVARMAYLDLETLTPGDLMSMVLVLMDRLLEDEETQVHGVVFMEDLEEVSFYQMFKLAQLEHIQKGLAIELIQEALPARFKGIHIVNQPWYVSIIFSIIKPFLKQKLKERIHFHGADFEDLHGILPAEHLPEQFGGQLASLDDYTASTLFPELSPEADKTD